MKTPRYCPAWDPDPDVPPDYSGRETCRNCHRVGEASDAGHTAPAPPPGPKPMPAALAAAARARDAAVLGETDREEYR